MKLFLSYKFDDQAFVELVYYVLSKQPGIEPYYWPAHGHYGQLNDELEKVIDDCDGMIAFFGTELGRTQDKEIEYFLKRHPNRPLIPVQLSDDLPRGAGIGMANMVVEKIHPKPLDLSSARDLVKKIVDKLRLPWIPEDGLPSRYIVENEKEFLERFRCGNPELLHKLRTECGWTVWPKVEKRPASHPNPIDDDSIGTLTDELPEVLLDARTRVCNVGDQPPLTFPEARPRKELRYPLQKGGVFGVGVLVSGGIAPGINAVIDGIVTRHTLYSDRQRRAGVQHLLEIWGYREGFKGLIRPGVRREVLKDYSAHGKLEAGGAFLGTSRADILLPGDAQERDGALSVAVTKLRGDGIQILYVIGGDGSMSCAHALWHYARRMGYDLSVVGIPKAMDNDILWVWQSFGFLSAVEEARQAILHMHTEVSSNPRVGIIQLFGSDSGFIASHAGYSTACDLVLIPEDPMTMDDIVRHVKERLRERFQNGGGGTIPYAIVVMAETALPKDADLYCDDERAGLSEIEKQSVKSFLKNERHLRGQTPDELRRAGLKIVAGVLQSAIRLDMDPPEYWEDFRVITNEPRHLIRSIPPRVTDVIFGERLGALAVDNAMAGYTDFMVSQWLTEFVLVPLPLVVLGRKRVSTDGIFWKSVISKTKQRD